MRARCWSVSCRVWRRPVGAPEVDRFVKLFGEYRPQFESFEGAMVEVLATVLAHPEFLYLAQHDAGVPKAEPSGINEFELAGRLAVFLWSSIPDESLLDLARLGKLREPKVLAAQVDHMLADPRAKRFTRHFVSQWLGLDGLNSVDHIRDDQLRTAMARSPLHFLSRCCRPMAVSWISFIRITQWSTPSWRSITGFPMCTVCISARWPSRPGTNAAG